MRFSAAVSSGSSNVPASWKSVAKMALAWASGSMPSMRVLVTIMSSSPSSCTRPSVARHCWTWVSLSSASRYLASKNAEVVLKSAPPFPLVCVVTSVSLSTSMGTDMAFKNRQQRCLLPRP